MKQLAAVEISKKKKKEKVQENSELINNFMNPIENYYMLKCAQLEEERRLLTKKLNALIEDMGGVAHTPQQQQPLTQTAQTKVKGKKVAQEGEEEEDTSLEQKALSPQYGLAPTPDKSAAITDLLRKYSDNPETPQVEQPVDASWQRVNTSIGRAMQEKLRQLKAQQYMG